MSKFNLACALFNKTSIVVNDEIGERVFFKYITQLDTEHQNDDCVLVCGYVSGEFADKFIAVSVKLID